jgi:hypothetical protein
MKGWSKCERCTTITPAPYFLLVLEGPRHINIRLCQRCFLWSKKVPRDQRTKELVLGNK